MLEEELSTRSLGEVSEGSKINGVRHDWQLAETHQIYEAPLNDLLFKAHKIHRKYFDPNRVQLSTLLNIKTGGCSEDCAYCPQSAHFDTEISAEDMLGIETVKQAAQQAKDNGATRFCMGAAWRSPKEKDFVKVLQLVETVNALGLESCLTMGMLTSDQANRLKEAGLDYYNHNLDTSREYYQQIIGSRDFDDRLETLEYVRQSGMSVCCGGIIGMGEAVKDRLNLLITLANMPKHPESIPINSLIRVEGTPLANESDIDPFDMVRMVATARCMMPRSHVRLSAGRAEMNDELQAMCFFAGVNSIFYGEKLLTTENPQLDQDKALFKRLGIRPE